MDTVRVEEPVPPDERLTLAGFRDPVGPDGERDVERLTVPAKPSRLARLTVDVAEAPGERVNEAGLAEMLKSTTMTVTADVCVREPLVPVTVTVYDPIVEEPTVRVEEAEPPEERETLPGLRDRLRPEGEPEAESVTEPAKLFRLVRAIVDVDDEPAGTVKLPGLAEMLKSG